MRPIAGSTGAGSEGPKRSVPVAPPTRTPTPSRTPTPAAGPKKTPSPGSSNPYAALGLPTPPAGANSGITTWLSNQDSYEFPTWTSLDQRTRDLYNDIAKAYNVNSTGKAWYRDDFLPYVRRVLEETGIAPDPENVALTFARQAGYDVSDYLASSPVLSPNSILFDRPYGDPDTEPGDGSSSGSGSYGGSGGGGGYGGGGGGGGSVSLTNPTSARGLLMQTMQSVLGRDPSNSEYKTFLQVLNEAEMANPNTASFEGGMAVGSGGVDPGVLALEFAQDQEDYTERQGDRYFRTFMQALAGGV